jgi:DNA helicase II / ATP-dependent DNA helicase PcrA
VVAAADVLKGLDDEQRAVAQAVGGPVLVLAGAGTGKTTAITHRIAYAVATDAHDAQRSMAVTFTNRAAGQMRSRLAELQVEGVQVRTFHSAALRQLRHFWPRIAGNRQLPNVTANTKAMFDRALKRAGCTISTEQLRQVRDGIEALRMQREGVRTVTDATAAKVAADVDPADLIRIWRAYDEVKTEDAVLDFTDVLAATAGMYAMHPELLREVHRTYRWFTVDEYQDVSPLQWDLLRRWRGESRDVCVVGDANQTIYTFAGASANYLLDFAKEFDDSTSVQLTRCYRCTPPIVALANHVIARAPTFIHLTAQRDGGDEPTVQAFPDDEAEASAVADAIAEAVGAGTDPRDIAVLFRINAQAGPVELALQDRGIPVVTRGVDRFFQRPEIKEAMLRLRQAGGGDVSGAVQAVIEAMPKGNVERTESLATLLALARDVEQQFQAADTAPSVSAFVAHVESRARYEHVPTPYGVTLSTLHAAKGLEWRCVYLVGASDGLLPLDGADADEERRLCYVGVTRARDELHISWAAARSPGGSAYRMISPFFTDAVHSMQQPRGPRPVAASAPRRQTAPARCRVCGRGLVTARERTMLRCAQCPVQTRPALIDALRHWRDALAQERGVAGFQVMTDQAIEAVAELLPNDVESVLSIPGTRWLGADASGVLAVVRDSETGHPFVQH